MKRRSFLKTTLAGLAIAATPAALLVDEPEFDVMSVQAGEAGEWPIIHLQSLDGHIKYIKIGDVTFDRKAVMTSKELKCHTEGADVVVRGFVSTGIDGDNRVCEEAYAIDYIMMTRPRI